MNAKSLAMRDPAAAALLGITPGADFGAEFGDDDSDDELGAEFGDFGDDDDDYGAEAALAKVAPPSAMKLQAMWRARALSRARMNARTRLLNPNRGSPAKVEKYILALSQAVVIGAPAVLSLDGSPDCTFRPQRLTIVVPAAGMAVVSDIKMANVSVNIGPGQIDAFQFNANGVGQRMDLPTLTPANRARITGAWTAFTGGYPDALDFILSATFIGPSSLAGGSSSY